MPTFKLTTAYDGTAFCGWQSQPGRRTVQGVVGTAWQAITGEQPDITATSRTDAGVHAAGQVVGVCSETHLEPEQLFRALNAKLPSDVVVLSVELAADGFHATRDAIGKRYRYRIHNDRRRPLFTRHFVWYLPQPLDFVAMHEAGQSLVGKHDFASFQSAGSDRKSTVRTIFAVEVTRGIDPPANGTGDKDDDSPEIWIEVEGDGFLYNMVRTIAGTLVAIGSGRRPASWLAEVLAAADRRAAGQTAPPQGLTLLKVNFPRN